MDLLIDTNVLADVLMNREPFVKESKNVWKACETGIVRGFISTLSFADIVYFMRKELDEEQIRISLMQLSSIFTFVDLTFLDLKRASDLKWKDFEDAIQYVTAKKMNVEAIVTRNRKDFENGELFICSPEEIIKHIIV